jgi:hypothetical protein
MNMLEKMRPFYQSKLDQKMLSLSDEGKDSCQRCDKHNSSPDPDDHFSPNIEAFEMSGEVVCDECAEEVFEENGQFGAGA